MVRTPRFQCGNRGPIPLGATKGMQEKEIKIPIGKGENVKCFLTMPEAETFPLLIAVHGFSSWHDSEYNEYLRTHLVPQGWAFLSFDLRGHGASSGKLETITVDRSFEDLKAVYAFAKDMPGVESISLFGSSYGGLLASMLATEMSSIEYLGLRAPLIDFATQFEKKYKKIGITAWHAANALPFTCKDKKIRLIQYSYYESMKQIQGRVAALAPKIAASTLIIQGDKDQAVSIDRTYEFFENLKCEKDFIVVPGADHRFSNPIQKENMLKRFVEFYKQA